MPVYRERVAVPAAWWAIAALALVGVAAVFAVTSAWVLVIVPVKHDWVDILVGDPTPAQLYCIRAGPLTMPLTTMVPYTLDDARAWIALALSQSPQSHFAIALDDEAIGGIGLTPRDDVHRRSAEIGYWLGEAHWGRGIATAAVRAFTPWALEAYDLLRLDAYVFAGHDSSARVLEKAGYSREGVLRQAAVKQGRVLDIWLYAFLRDH